MRKAGCSMDEASITQYIIDTFAGVDVVRPETSGGPEIAWGDTFFIYDPHRDLEPHRKFPFATIVTKDYADFDNASNLNRPGVFRLNIGVSKNTFRSLLGEQSANAGPDYSALDQLLPHPTYATQSWVCVLNPTVESFERIKPLLLEAYELAAKKHAQA